MKSTINFFGEFFLSVTACVFIAMFINRKEKENPVKEIISNQMESYAPIPKRDIAKMINEMSMGPLVLNLVTNQPDKGSPTIAVIGITINKFPSCASLR